MKQNFYTLNNKHDPSTMDIFPTLLSVKLSERCGFTSSNVQKIRNV